MNLQLSSSPLVSVVIPVYNGEMHISVCMDSILCQSFSSFEAIFVDDGSVDNSFRILSERASFDRRMKVIRQENMGVIREACLTDRKEETATGAALLARFAAPK